MGRHMTGDLSNSCVLCHGGCEHPSAASAVVRGICVLSVPIELCRMFCRTICGMNTLTIRTDAEVEHALDALVGEGATRSQAVRAAILETERAHRRARMRAEAEALRDDPDDVRASRELAAEMDETRAW